MDGPLTFLIRIFNNTWKSSFFVVIWALNQDGEIYEPALVIDLLDSLLHFTLHATQETIERRFIDSYL